MLRLNKVLFHNINRVVGVGLDEEEGSELSTERLQEGKAVLKES